MTGNHGSYVIHNVNVFLSSYRTINFRLASVPAPCILMHPQIITFTGHCSLHPSSGFLHTNYFILTNTYLTFIRTDNIFPQIFYNSPSVSSAPRNPLLTVTCLDHYLLLADPSTKVPIFIKICSYFT